MRQNGLRDGHHGCHGARFFVSGTENRAKTLVYFLRFFALQRSRQSTAQGDLNYTKSKKTCVAVGKRNEKIMIMKGKKRGGMRTRRNFPKPVDKTGALC